MFWFRNKKKISYTLLSGWVIIGRHKFAVFFFTKGPGGGNQSSGRLKPASSATETAEVLKHQI